MGRTSENNISEKDIRRNALLVLTDKYNIHYEIAAKFVSEELDIEAMGLFEQLEILFITIIAKNQFLVFLNKRRAMINEFIEQRRKEQSLKKEFESTLKWKGNNETEFVQFAYAMFHANKIGMMNDEDEITKLVPELAKLLNFDLGENWQGNHSKSIHNRNGDYIPPIFEDIATGYKKYATDKEEKKKKRKI